MTMENIIVGNDMVDIGIGNYHYWHDIICIGNDYPKMHLMFGN